MEPSRNSFLWTVPNALISSSAVHRIINKETTLLAVSIANSHSRLITKLINAKHALMLTHSPLSMVNVLISKIVKTKLLDIMVHINSQEADSSVSWDFLTYCVNHAH